MLTFAKRRLLVACQSVSLNAGRCELSLETGLSGAALENVIESCLRNGWIDAATGKTTDSGTTLLRTTP